jgi:long-chain acyl-CoA synthetase
VRVEPTIDGQPRLPVHRFAGRTLPALLDQSAGRVPDRPFIRFFDPASPETPRVVTYDGFRALVRRAAAYLAARGVGPGDRVLLLAENSPEWPAVALAAMTLRAEPAGLFASLGAGPAEEIARRVRPTVIFVSGEAQWRKVQPAAADLAGAGLAAVLSLSPLPPGSLPPGVAPADGAAALSEGALALAPADFTAQAAALTGEDPFLLLFTSGTTGRQKGVRLRQRSIVAAIECGAAGCGTTEHDLGIHLLPFGHVAGHDQFCLALAQGHSLAMIASRDDLVRALALSPTYLFSVPLVYERIRGQALEKVAQMPAPVRALVHAALDAAARVRVDGRRGAGDRALALVADLTVGRKLRSALGGRVRGIYAGGAPASTPLFRFFEGLGFPFVELYGMTETAGLVSMNPLAGPRRAGCVGLVTPDHEVRIAPDGELLLRGPLLLAGYLEASDAEGAFTEDGFYRTGDLAHLEADGSLWITGRKKHLMVLSTGKKVAPEPIETALGAAEPFQGAVVVGEGRPFLAAAVFVPQAELDRLAAHGRDAAEALLPAARAALEAFSEHEKPKKLIVIPGAPTDLPALLTPSLKVKREAFLAFLGPRLSQLYA